MRWPRVWAVAWRDLRVVTRSRLVMLPMILVPVILLVILPVGMSLLPRLTPASLPRDVEKLTANLPPVLIAAFAGLTPAQISVVFTTTYMLAPLFLMIPILVTSGLAADAFAGERERRTLEALLYTPLSDRELFTAKTLVALLPALAVTVVGFVAYAIVVNAAAWPMMHRVFFPNATWLWMILWVAPAVALLGLAAMVLVSMRVRDVQESMQISGLLVLPLIALVVAQARGTLLLGPRVVALLGLALWIAALALISYGVRTFRRERLIADV